MLSALMVMLHCCVPKAVNAICSRQERQNTVVKLALMIELWVSGEILAEDYRWNRKIGETQPKMKQGHRWGGKRARLYLKIRFGKFK